MYVPHTSGLGSVTVRVMLKIALRGNISPFVFTAISAKHYVTASG